MIYRYRGRFVSESRARSLSGLKGPSQYITTESKGRKIEGYVSARTLERQAAEAARQRSQAARRGWETRREHQEQRSEAARRGWETRRHLQRSEAARRGWETRRARERAEAPPAPPSRRVREEEIPPEEAEEEIPSGYYVDVSTGELIPESELPPGAETDEETREAILPEYEFEGYEYDEDYSDFEDYFLDMAMADLDDEDKYEQAD